MGRNKVLIIRETPMQSHHLLAHKVCMLRREGGKEKGKIEKAQLAFKLGGGGGGNSFEIYTSGATMNYGYCFCHQNIMISSTVPI
jgi:hypothetical protein